MSGRLKVLIAEPDDALRSGLRGLLEHHGHFAECAREATDAIKLGLRLTPDLLITSETLAEETTGKEVALGLLHQGVALAIIVLITGRADEAAVRWLGFPVIDYLTTPPSFTRLLDAIEANVKPIDHPEEDRHG